MMIEEFISKIENFNNLSSSRMIDYFIYFHTIVKGNEGVKTKDIEIYFEELKLPKYSNISQYISKSSKKIKGKTQKFIFKKNLYHLERTQKNAIDEEIKIPKALILSNNYFPIEIFENTRGYLKTISSQAVGCYDNGLYDGCSVMTRKLLEILIIEAFERNKIETKIQNIGGNFFYLSDLIDRFVNETSWNISRNAKSSIPNLKKMGDLSAHNRRYVARQGDIDKLKDDLRIVLEELIHIIDYPNWNNR